MKKFSKRYLVGGLVLIILVGCIGVFALINSTKDNAPENKAELTFEEAMVRHLAEDDQETHKRADEMINQNDDASILNGTLIKVNVFNMREDYESSLEAIDIAKQKIQDLTPAILYQLEVTRANVLSLQEKYQEAIDVLDAIIDKNDDLNQVQIESIGRLSEAYGNNRQPLPRICDTAEPGEFEECEVQ